MISVCIATYNGEKFIRGQIGTVLAQLSSNDELVISDDDSKDNTLEIIKSFNDPRIKIFKGPAKGHPRYNFENGLNHCKGDYIFLCDQDDVWEPNRINSFMNYLKDYDVVVCDCKIVDENDHVIADSFMEMRPPQKRGFVNNLKANHYIGCCMAFRRELLRDVLPFPKYVAQHDMWIGLCAEYIGYRILFIDDKLTRYRRYGNNFSQVNVPSWERIKYRVYLLWQIIIHKTKRKLTK